MCHNLRCGIAYAINVDREDAGGAGRDGDGFGGEVHTAHIELDTLLVGERLQAFVVVDKNECAVSLAAVRPSEVCVIALFYVLWCRECGIHICQHLAIVLHKQVQFAQHEIMWIELSELSYGSLEVVVFYRHVVVVGGSGALVFIQRVQIAFGIGAPVIHVIAQQVASAAQFHRSHGIGIFRIDERAAVVGCCHASSQFAGEVGVLVFFFVQGFLLCAQLFGGNGCGTAEGFEVKSLVVVACGGLEAPVPKTVSIVAIQGYHFAERYWCAQFGPSGAGVERQVKAYLCGNLLECHEV